MIVKNLAWCLRVHIYNLPFQAIAFYFEYNTQNVYSVLYIPEIITCLYFVSFPMGSKLVMGAIDDYRGNSSELGSNVEEVFKSLSSLFNIKDTQNKMWLVPLLWLQDNLMGDRRDRRNRRPVCSLVFECFFGYFFIIVLIFLINIGSWLPYSLFLSNKN